MGEFKQTLKSEAERWSLKRYFWHHHLWFFFLKFYEATWWSEPIEILRRSNKDMCPNLNRWSFLDLKISTKKLESQIYIFGLLWALQSWSKPLILFGIVKTAMGSNFSQWLGVISRKLRKNKSHSIYLGQKGCIPATLLQSVFKNKKNKLTGTLMMIWTIETLHMLRHNYILILEPLITVESQEICKTCSTIYLHF